MLNNTKGQTPHLDL